MGYSRETYDRCLEILTERRRRAESEALARQEDFFSHCPRGAEIKAELSKTAYQTAKAVLQGINAAEKIRALKDRNLELQDERAGLLAKNGFPADYLEVRYNCGACRDTGYVNGKMCSCLKKLLRKTEYDRLNASAPLALSTFESFSLSYYAGEDRKKMASIMAYAQKYAEVFSEHCESLLFLGGTGLGKTHLSLAIADRVLKKGYGVIYTTSQNLALKLDKERFSNDGSDTYNLYMECDLLILDDLGTEFTTSYVTAAIYNLINTRLMRTKPTIISTNLTVKELENRYSERLVSRMIGDYVFFHFAGKDIRQKKKTEEIKKQL